jgi:hypothetical protein
MPKKSGSYNVTTKENKGLPARTMRKFPWSVLSENLPLTLAQKKEFRKLKFPFTIKSSFGGKKTRNRRMTRRHRKDKH